ncbi:MAG: PAC2 family protein [Candidatus Woesearchaeota archaeon]
MVSWEITTEAKKVELKNPVLIEGLPGIGNVGKIAVDFLVEELKAEKLCSFFSYRFPHSVFVNEDNLVEMPKIEIYYKKFKDKKKRDLLLLTGDIQPIDEDSCFSFCEEIIKIAKEHKCNELVTTGGIGLQKTPEKPKVYCTGNDEKLIKKYIGKGSLVEKDIFGVVGPIVGVSGILIGLGKKRRVKGVALLAETFGHPMYLGIKGAKELLKVLDKQLILGLNIKKLDQEIIKL